MFSRFFFTKKETRQPRKYQVPEGLVPQVVSYMDAMEARYSPRAARRELWKLLEERCPEVVDGQWAIEQHGPRVFVVERLPS